MYLEWLWCKYLIAFPSELSIYFFEKTSGIQMSYDEKTDKIDWKDEWSWCAIKIKHTYMFRYTA